MCDSDRRRVTELKGGFDIGISRELNSRGEAHVQGGISSVLGGFTRIVPGKAVRFDVDCKGTKIVYITIIAQDGDPTPICEGIPKQEDFSVMVTKQRQIVDVVYGTVCTPVPKISK